MRPTKRIALGLLLAATMGLPAPTAFAEGNPDDGNWLASRCKAARLAFAVKQQQLEGHVKVQYDITANGRVTNIRIVESVPEGVMDRSVTSAIRGWRYFAYIKDGVEARRKDVALTFTFGGDTAMEPSCTHSPLPDTTTAAAK